MPWIDRRVRAGRERFSVRALVDGKRVRLASFNTREEAAAHRDAIAGEFRPRGENLRAGSPDRSRGANTPTDVGDRIRHGSSAAASGCVLWNGQLDRDGYGRMTVARTDGGAPRKALVHREAYAAFVGPLIDGLTIDHTCHNADPNCTEGRECVHRRCVKPAHLEQVTFAENTARRDARKVAA